MVQAIVEVLARFESERRLSVVTYSVDRYERRDSEGLVSNGRVNGIHLKAVPRR